MGALLRRRSLPALLVLAACGGGEPDEAEPAPGAEPPAAASTAQGLLPADGVHRVTGEFLVGTDRRDFLPCEGGAEYWVDGPALPDLMAIFQELTPGIEPYEAVFVDVLADMDPPPASGPGASLAGTVLVLELRRAAFEGASCRSADSAVVAEARGNEPFWRLEALADGVRFETPEGGWDWEALPLAPSPEGWTLQGTTHLGESFTLTLELGGCQDSMSGAWFHLGSVLAVGDRRYEGCGWLGPAAEL